MEKIYGVHELVELQLFWSGTPTFSSGTPTFCQMGVLNSCFQNPSESSVIVFIFRFKNCNSVLVMASAANIDSNSLALTASIFTLSTYMGIVIFNPVLCRKILNVYINILPLTEK